jgi:glutathione S-transferase
LDINPKGLVPAIEFHGKPLRESLVVAEFVEDTFPRAPRLLPSDPFTRGRMRLWIDHASKLAVPAFFRALQAQEPDAQKDGVDALSAALRELADEVEGPYFLGEQFTLIDAVVAPVRVASCYKEAAHIQPVCGPRLSARREPRVRPRDGQCEVESLCGRA